MDDLRAQLATTQAALAAAMAIMKEGLDALDTAKRELVSRTAILMEAKALLRRAERIISADVVDMDDAIAASEDMELWASETSAALSRIEAMEAGNG